MPTKFQLPYVLQISTMCYMLSSHLVHLAPSKKPLVSIYLRLVDWNIWFGNASLVILLQYCHDTLKVEFKMKPDCVLVTHVFLCV